MFFLIIIGVFFGVIVFAAIAREIKKQNASIARELEGIQDFSPTQQIAGADSKSVIAIDEKRNKLCLLDLRLPSLAALTEEKAKLKPGEKLQIKRISSKTISAADLLSCELFENGTTISKTVRSSQIGGVLIGGLALGGVGAIIGGLSGKTSFSEIVSRIDLRLIVNDTQNPLFDINFLNTKTKKDSFIYREAMEKARHWHGLMEVLIKRADAQDKDSAPKLPAVASVADEIKKLAELRDSGILSADEFQQQKERLLQVK